MKLFNLGKLTRIQAEEAGKFLLGLCQASAIGTVGVIFVKELDLIGKIIFMTLGLLISIVLFVVAMRLFREVKEK